MVSLALLSSASPVCLTQFHTNCPHSTSHGESYRKRVQASSEAKSRKWPREYGPITYVIHVTRDMHISEVIPSECHHKKQSQLMFFFSFLRQDILHIVSTDPSNFEMQGSETNQNQCK